MANRLKEDEKNERIIRGLLKLPPNRRCINCNSLGPQYVCTSFWTFVCTNCSGVHREFTHRVKSISMSKFTSQEVSALQEGGNQRAKETYFKEWDPQRHYLPDSRLRDFIKHVYVDRRFTGERNSDKPPRVKTGEKDDLYENRRVETYQGGARSPPYEDTYERRYSDRSSPGGRSPGSDQESRQYGDYKKSPGRPPVINDWYREDRFGDGKRLEDRRISDRDYKLEGQSPERAKDLDSSPPVVRPVRDILGENVVPLRISGPPRANSGRATDGSTLTQRTASSSSLASSNGNPTDVKLETAKSLIDFDVEPEPPVAPAISQSQQITVTQSVVQLANSGDDKNWASFDVAPEAKASQGPSNVNPLESVLSQLSVTASLPAHASGVQVGPNVAIPGASVQTLPRIDNSSVSPIGPVPASAIAAATAGAATVSSFPTFPPSVASVTAPGLTIVSPFNNTGQWASLQHQQPLFPATVSQATNPQVTLPVGGVLSNPSWNIAPAPTIQGHTSTPIPHAPHLVSEPANGANSGVISQHSTVEAKQTGRKELPEDLFTVKYSSFSAPVPGWQVGPHHGMGFSMQYNPVVQPMPSFLQSSKSSNPFDASNERAPVQAPTFPSMSSLQGALPNIPPSGMMHPSSLGNPSLAWNPPQSSYGSLLPPQAQTHATAIFPRPYMGQQMPTNMPILRPQEIGSFGTQGAAFGFSNPEPQLSGRLSTPATSNSFSAGGNPFG